MGICTVLRQCHVKRQYSKHTPIPALCPLLSRCLPPYASSQRDEGLNRVEVFKVAFSEISVNKYSESNRLEVARGEDNGQSALSHPNIAISMRKHRDRGAVSISD